MADPVVDFKQRQRAAWSAGDYPEVGRTIAEPARRLVERAGVGEGMDVLDVGAGTGNAAIPAAQAGARVVASDLTPELFEAGRRNAAEAGVELEWVEADAEALPFGGAEFDRVLSSFGVIFAPRHAVAAAEMARVCCPGGAIAVNAWDPDGFPGRLLRMIGSHLPAPPDFAQSPVLWGDEGHLRELFDPSGAELEVHRDDVAMAWDSMEDALDFYEAKFGVVALARPLLEREGRWDDLHRDLEALIAECDRGGGGVSIASAYLTAVARIP